MCHTTKSSRSFVKRYRAAGMDRSVGRPVHNENRWRSICGRINYYPGYVQDLQSRRE